MCCQDPIYDVRTATWQFLAPHVLQFKFKVQGTLINIRMSSNLASQRVQRQKVQAGFVELPDRS